MGAQRITIRNIDAAKLAAKRGGSAVFLWDTDVKGFGIKASPTGAVSYVVQKSIGGRTGKRKRVTLGHYPAKDIDAARKEAGKAVSDVHAGIDFVEVKREVRREQKARLDYDLLSTFEDYAARKRQPGRYRDQDRSRVTPSRYWPNVEGIFRNHIIPALGKGTPVPSITKADVRKLIEAKESVHPEAARCWFAYLRPFFKWCVERDIIASSPMDKLNPPPVGESRDRKLSETELRVFWQANERLGYPFGTFYQLLLLTAQRREEVAAMRWPEIDLAKGEWIIPKERTKNGKEHLVHLSPQAVEILQTMVGKDRKGFVFTTTGKTPISGYSKAKAKLDALCATVVDDEFSEFLPQIFQTEWRVHDLRRTAASGMAELGFQPHIVERVLNHISGAQGGLVGVYQRFDYAEDRRRALIAWGAQVRALVVPQNSH